MLSPADIATVAGHMASPRARISVLTGAGMSAASGVPTFRDEDGLWKQHKPEDLATPGAFAKDPQLVWEWYEWRRQVLAACRPNQGHEVLASWSRRYPGFSLVTQNVDGLHERAGTKGVVRFHGSIWDVSCWQRCPDAPRRWRDESVPFARLPPTCPHCAGPLRPGVVWFGEAIDPAVLEASEQAADCDVFLVIGTSALVHPAAGLVDLARATGAFTVEINPQTTPVTGSVDVALMGRADQALVALEQALSRGESEVGEPAG